MRNLSAFPRARVPRRPLERPSPTRETFALASTERASSTTDVVHLCGRARVAG
jgi:hypothetical protein